MAKNLTPQQEREAETVRKQLAEERECPVRCAGCTSKSCGV